MKGCLQKTVQIRTFPQFSHFILVLKVWERFSSYKKDQNTSVKKTGTSNKQKLVQADNHSKEMKQSKEMKRNWTGTENLDNHFCVIFDCHYKNSEILYPILYFYQRRFWNEYHLRAHFETPNDFFA